MVSKPDAYELILREAIQEEIEQIPVPNLEDVWLKIEENTKRKRGLRAFFTSSKTIGVAVAIILIGIISSLSLGVEVFYRTILQSIGDVLENAVVMQLDHKIGLKESKAEPKLLDAAMVHQVTLPEAMHRSSFGLLVPKTMPKGYQLEELTLTEVKGTTLEVAFLYRSINHAIQLRQRPADSYQIDPMNGIQGMREEILMEGIVYTLITGSDGITHAFWQLGEIKLLAKGSHRQELLELIFSIE